MRRKDRSRTDQEFINDVLSNAEEIYVGFYADPAPYVIPLNYVYLHDKIYIHCAPEGRKIDCAKANTQVGFSTATNIEISKEKSTTYYSCISGTGRARIVEDKVEKHFALDAIALRYNANCEIPTPEKMLENTAIICIEIEAISGKCNPKPAD